jgi:ABC-type amino acid transport substrate-binding protein
MSALARISRLYRTSCRYLVLHRHAIAWSLALAMPAVSGVYWLFLNEPITRTVTIGFQNSPPYHYPDAQGNPTGAAVDVIKTAAMRSHIRLKWVWAPGNLEQTLKSGNVDLWPVVVNLPERRGLLHVTAPWGRLWYSMLLPETSRIAIPGDVRGKTLAVTANIGSDARTARKYFPGAAVLSRPSPREVVTAVCSGQAEVGLIQSNALSSPKQADCDSR